MSLGYEPVFALDESAMECPYHHFKQAREKCPVSFSEATSFWVISDHEHVTKALKDPATFSTKYMLGPQVDKEWQMLIERAAERPEGKAAIGPDYGKSPRKILLFADPPEHGRHRKLIMGALTPAAIRSWEPKIRETANHYVDLLAQQPEVEFVVDIATPYTMAVIADILGQPREMVPQMLRWTEGFNSMVGNPNLTEDELNALVDVRLGFDLYFADQIKQREQNPTGDLISRIVELNKQEGYGLTTDELLMVVQLNVVGGSDTSSTALAKMIEHLCEHPEQWTRMKNDPSFIPAFIEELLRTEAPVQGVFRYVTKDVELGGQQLKEGDFVWLSFGSANRDPKVFDDPDTKDFDRTGTPAKYVSFGGGPHLCPGVPLSRLELRIMLEAMTSRFDGVEFTDGKSPSKKSFLFFGPSELNVRFTPTV